MKAIDADLAIRPQQARRPAPRVAAYRSLDRPREESERSERAREERRSALPRISRLALADPDTSFSQEDVLRLLGLSDDRFARRIFNRCGVERRQLKLTDELLATTVQGRTPAIEEDLFGYAVRAIDQLSIDPAEIGVVVSSTLYSLGGPTIAHRLVDHYEMDPSTDKYHIVGVGCASAVPLVRLAVQALRDRPGRKALVVAAESMAGILMAAGEHDERSKTVGSSIFGDGCAAALVESGDDSSSGGEGLRESGDGSSRGGEGLRESGDGSSRAGQGLRESGDGPSGGGGRAARHDEGAGLAGPAVVASKVHQIGGTLGAVRMQLTSEDSYLHLIRELPELAGTGLLELVEDFLADSGLEHGSIDHWLVHPGGRRIIESVQRALALSREDVETSYGVLAEHGNVGTPSIFYVLARTLEQRRPRRGEHGLMVTVGPGVTVGLMLLQW